jgi:P-type Ca2+ transporter type 2C
MKENNNYHHLEADETLRLLSSEVTGLEADEAKKRFDEYGPNELTDKKKKSLFVLYLKQFNNPLIYILFVAAIISLLFHKTIDFYVILGVILINATIGFVQEFQAEKSIEALKKMIVSSAKIFRKGQLIEVNTRDLVPGDVLFIEEGDKIPADARIIEAKNLRTQESSLTGESYPVSKLEKILPENTPISDRLNMVWMGTFAVSGEAKAVVTNTGNKTVLGQIATSIEEIERNKWHFEIKTAKLAKQLGIIAFSASTLIFLIGYFIRGFTFSEIFLFTIASLVSSIPEGLPAVITIVLAIGAHRMAQRNAITRALPSIETLSVVDTIITDKTGTLTQNTINAERIILPGNGKIDVTGEGWKPQGTFHQDGEAIIPLDNAHLSKMLHIIALCNNARVIKEEDKGEDEYGIIGDPTEAALAVLALKGGVVEEIVAESQIKIDDLPFNSEKKYRASLVELTKEKNTHELFVVGAPEYLIKNSTSYLKNGRELKSDAAERKELLKKVEELASSGLRTVAIAVKTLPKNTKEIHENMVSELTLVGIVGMKDPLRHDVKEAIEKAQHAGIRVIMATGDHKNTALSIAKEIGLVNEDSKKMGFPEVLTGEQLEKLPKKKFIEAIQHVSVFARLSPQMKLKIAAGLQKFGATVAMTGDGVNDAAALKKADIGISMGIIGSDVARESSEIVLADDNFASIINAVEEGRVVFNNTRRVSTFLVTTSFAGSTTILSTLLLGLPLPFLPIQILWINLVTDTVAGATLATEPGHKIILDMPPRKLTDNILSKELIPFILLMVVLMITLTVGSFYVFLPQGIEKARTAAFLMLALTQLFNMFNLRSLADSIFKIGFLSNKNTIYGFLISVTLIIFVIYLPFMKPIFNFEPLLLVEFMGILAASSGTLFVAELYKALANHKGIES